MEQRYSVHTNTFSKKKFSFIPRTFLLPFPLNFVTHNVFDNTIWLMLGAQLIGTVEFYTSIPIRFLWTFDGYLSHSYQEKDNERNKKKWKKIPRWESWTMYSNWTKIYRYVTNIILLEDNLGCYFRHSVWI